MKGRVTGLTVIVLLFFALVLGQAVFIQVHRAAGLNADPANPRNKAVSVQFAKGEILASNGMVLARSIPTGDSTYPWRRGYPLASLTSDVVGYSSFLQGTGGIENQYNKYLVSHPLPLTSITQVLSPDRAPDNVSLTLQVALQQVAARALAGRDGAVVALDPRDGSILAMYSNPTFNPAPLASTSADVQRAAWAKYTTKNANGFEPLGNVATQQTFPPGSTFKVVTTAAVYRFWPGLAEKSYPVSNNLSLEPWSNRPLYNAGLGACGGTIAVMLPESCDPGYGAVGLDLGGKFLATQANQFGFNSVPPLDLPAGMVVPSYFPPGGQLAKEGNQPFLAYSAIGQKDVRATALQDALVAAGIANGGKVMAPHLLRSITDSQGRVVKTWQSYVWRRPLNAAEAAEVVPLMRAVVTGGTASGVGFLYQDEVAAKTGTAQTGVLTAPHTDDWMIAFAPASHPVVAVGVVVPYQDVSFWGAQVAGPIVKCVIEGALAIDAGQRPSGTATTCPS